MAIVFPCSKCGATLRVRDESAGKRIRCGKCEAATVVPEPEEDERPVIEPTPATTAARRRARPNNAATEALKWRLIGAGIALFLIVGGIVGALISGGGKG